MSRIEAMELSVREKNYFERMVSIHGHFMLRISVYSEVTNKYIFLDVHFQYFVLDQFRDTSIGLHPYSVCYTHLCQAMEIGIEKLFRHVHE